MMEHREESSYSLSEKQPSIATFPAAEKYISDMFCEGHSSHIPLNRGIIRDVLAFIQANEQVLVRPLRVFYRNDRLESSKSST